MSARKSSHRTIFLIVSSGSPLALIASSLRSTSKNPVCPMARSLHPPMAHCGQRVRFVATWREEFFKVPYRHFTGAVCATSSDGRFALFSAPSTAAFSLASRLSNSSDILLPDIFRTAPIAVGSLLRAAERLVALPTAWDLFICAKDLFVEAKAPQASAPKRLR